MHDVCALYTALADAYGDSFLDEAGARLLQFAATAPGRLLDVGAGRGAVTRPAIAAGFEVVAVDGSRRMIQLLNQDCPTADASVMRAECLEFADESFDVVTAGYVLDLVADLARVISEIQRVLRPGGTFAFSEPGHVATSWHWLHDLAAEHFDRPDAHRMRNDHEQTIERILREIEDSVFGPVEHIALNSPIVFNDVVAAWNYLQENGGIAAACRELEPQARERFTREISVGLCRMLDADGCIEIQRDALLFRAVRR